MAIPPGELKSKKTLLDALGALADPQVALRLLRSSPRLLKEPRLLRLILWLTDASAPLPGFTWLTSSGNKPFPLPLTDYAISGVACGAVVAFDAQLRQAAHVLLSVALGKKEADLSNLLA